MVFLGKAIYSFEAQEVRNPMLQTVHKPELKWWRYGYLNQGCKKGDVFLGLIEFEPISFWLFGIIFWAICWAQFAKEIWCLIDWIWMNLSAKLQLRKWIFYDNKSSYFLHTHSCHYELVLGTNMGCTLRHYFGKCSCKKNLVLNLVDSICHLHGQL